MKGWFDETNEDLEKTVKKWFKDTNKYPEKRIEDSETVLTNDSMGVDKITVDIIRGAQKEEIEEKWKLKDIRERESKELRWHREFVTKIFASFLGDIARRSYPNPIEGLEFYLNTLWYVIFSDISLKDSKINKSAFSYSTITNSVFTNSTIIDTDFAFSDITDCDFSDSEITASLFDQVVSLKGVKFNGTKFEDVFFAESDLTDADFTGAKGLKPIYFFKAKNIDKAKFDEGFKSELEDKMGRIDEIGFKDYIKNSTLSKSRIDDLLRSLTFRLNDLSE